MSFSSLNNSIEMLNRDWEVKGYWGAGQEGLDGDRPLAGEEREGMEGDEEEEGEGGEE